MGDHRLPGNQARRTVKPKSQDKAGKYVPKNSSKCFLKLRKEQTKMPTSVEAQQRQNVKERPDDFRKSGTPIERLTPRSMENSLFPTISRRARSSINNKSQRKLTSDSGLYHSPLPVQHRSFLDDIGAHQNNHLLSPWPRGEDTSADILIKMLETPKYNRTLEYKWPFWEDHREATKQPTNSCKPSQGKFDLDPHRLSWSCRCSWLHDSKHRRQDLLDSSHYKYIYKGGEDKWAESFRDPMKQTDTRYENQLSYEESPVKKTDLCTFDLKYNRKMSRIKDITLSKQETSFIIKLQTHQNAFKAHKEIMNEPSYLKSNHLTILGNEDPVTDPDDLELQCDNISDPGKVEQAFKPTDWKYYIRKDDPTTSTLEQLFMRKRWACGCSSPTSKIHSDGEDYNNNDEEGKKVMEHQKKYK
ncbi:uncharacterized protein LOC110542428 [Meriones unguiculatus]|uniref:uncharacterized protein LOC110542428 n=1 Tax=Meriones unguiculatus TaxID=10047 RepID=UPI000B4F7B70|nr:uncharacterized protein LOC110542428 [Meriones unguiculatus]